jgi:hypothetical protein
VYEHDPEEVEEPGWEEFIARQWDSIFVGYRSWTGLRTMGRRWSDLVEAGLGCSQDVADRTRSAGMTARRWRRDGLRPAQPKIVTRLHRAGRRGMLFGGAPRGDRSPGGC